MKLTEEQIRGEVRHRIMRIDPSLCGTEGDAEWWEAATKDALAAVRASSLRRAVGLLHERGWGDPQACALELRGEEWTLWHEVGRRVRFKRDASRYTAAFRPFRDSKAEIVVAITREITPDASGLRWSSPTVNWPCFGSVPLKYAMRLAVALKASDQLGRMMMDQLRAERGRPRGRVRPRRSAEKGPA